MKTMKLLPVCLFSLFYIGFFAMLGILAMQVIQFSLASYFLRSHKLEDVESSDSSKPNEQNYGKIDTEGRKSEQARSEKITKRTTVLLLESGIG
jgi:hypothetical protein